jgi:nitronate monooxygenase
MAAMQRTNRVTIIAMTHPSLNTRFVQRFHLNTPIALAPMALATGGALAAACAQAGALGLVGGGYGDLAWTQREYTLATELLIGDAASHARLGCGFITWKLDENAEALDWVLTQKPCAIMLSFGDPRPYAARIQASGAQLICQVQRLDQVAQAIEAGASVIVAQGGEAGGHGANAREGRSTFTLVPEIADFLTTHSPNTLLLAAGGVADGRGVAAALMLGADGVLVGSRLWATTESLAAAGAKTQATQTNGDGTARSEVFDILRRKNWPAPYDFRAIRNDLHLALEDDIGALKANPDVARANYDAGVKAGDFTRAHATVGEAVGLIADIPSTQALIDRITLQAQRLLAK